MAIVFKLEPTKWEKIFANNSSHKGSIFKINNSGNSTIKNQPIKKMGRGPE